MKQRLLLTVAGIAMSCVHVNAQSIGPSALNAAGGSAGIGGNTYEYSLGAITLAQTYSSASLVVTDGVLQPNTASTGVSSHGITANELSVYPNPVESTLFLQPGFSGSGSLQFALTDAAGKTIYRQSKQLSQGNERQEIRMSALAAGQYMLNVTWLQAGKQSANTYKIQKLK